MSVSRSDSSPPTVWYSPDEQCNVLDVDGLIEWLKQERDRYPDSPRYNTLDWLVRLLIARRSLVGRSDAK